MTYGKKEILLQLYGEAADTEKLRSLLRDEELRQEHALLSETKFRLDLLEKERPDTAIVDAIVAAAASNGGTPHAKRLDRPARARSPRRRTVLISALSIAAVVLVGTGIGLDWFGGSSGLSASQQSPAMASHQDDLVPPESLHQLVPTQQLRSLASRTDPRLAWDDASPILDMHRRIQTMRPASPLDWGEAAVPLESLPGSSPGRLQMTGSSRQ